MYNSIIEYQKIVLYNLYGKKTEFVGPSPEELGVDMKKFAYPIVPFISDKEIKL